MRRFVAVLVTLAIAAGAAGCGPAPYAATRDVLGRAATATLYPDGAPARAAAASAFDRMDGVERTLNTADPASPIAAIDATPYARHRLPLEAVMVFTVADAWSVGPTTTRTPAPAAGRQTWTAGAYSPTVGAVSALYAGGATSAPAPAALAEALRGSRQWARSGETFAFLRSPAATGAVTTPPALDFTGVDDGIALDFALQQLGGLDGGLLTLGSTALAFGALPKGEPWRVSVDDPDRPGTPIAVIAATPRPDSTVTVPPVPAMTAATAGGRSLVLDPATGRPAESLRMLTVFGRMNAVDAAILSRALLVMGRAQALAYARAHGIGVLAIEPGGGRTAYVPPSLPGFTVEKPTR